MAEDTKDQQKRTTLQVMLLPTYTNSDGVEVDHPVAKFVKGANDERVFVGGRRIVRCVKGQHGTITLQCGQFVTLPELFAEEILANLLRNEEFPKGSLIAQRIEIVDSLGASVHLDIPTLTLDEQAAQKGDGTRAEDWRKKVKAHSALVKKQRKPAKK